MPGGKPYQKQVRFEQTNGKKTYRTFTWLNRRWVGKRPDKLLLYKLDQLSDADDTVILVEGEKAADAAQMGASGVFVTTWPCGADAIDLVDFSPLKNRKVALWPDNDEAGWRAMDRIYRILTDSAEEVMLIKPVGQKNSKNDAADLKDVEAIKRWLKKDQIEYPEPPEPSAAGGGADHGGHLEVRFGRGDLLIRNCLEALGSEIRYNVRDDLTEYSRAGSAWASVNDNKEGALICEIERRCEMRQLAKSGEYEMRGVRVEQQAWTRTIQSICDANQADPFLDYLNELPKWDGQHRLSELFFELFDVDMTELNEWALASVLIGCIERAVQPGYKKDEIVVLIGEPGIGKSTFWARLLPNTRWFGDDLIMSLSPKERVEAIQGKVLVECPELAGIRKVEINAMKAFVSRQSDHIRLSYRRNAEDLPRRCVFVGTSNDMECLPNDPGGNRRFIPVVVRGEHGNDQKVFKYLKENRGLLWAEALERYRKGERSFLPVRLRDQQQELAEEHRSGNMVLEDKLDQHWETLVFRGVLSLEQICEIAKIEYSPFNAGVNRALADLLRVRGAVRRKGKPAKWMFPKAGEKSLHITSGMVIRTKKDGTEVFEDMDGNKIHE